MPKKKFTEKEQIAELKAASKKFFIVTRPRITWETYLVEAENEGEAQGGDGKYLGVTDDDYRNGAQINVEGPFESETQAMADNSARTEWQ